MITAYLIQSYAIMIGIFIAYMLIVVTYEGAICPFGMVSGNIDNTFEYLSREFDRRVLNNYVFTAIPPPKNGNIYTLPDTNVFSSKTLLDEQFQKAWKQFITDSGYFFYIVSKTSPIIIKFANKEISPKNDTIDTIVIYKSIMGGILQFNNIVCKNYF